ncbi:hypothetical protein BpHYR1_044853 [Brachionus plicatilis]|uniref:Uncharacterized protein n=1 Tax=Brachionus plicatilis TaxID=10195 RepID=A0A3M7QVX2_BRAPC|nr:hypothetical protein BpHYR1_044853 [Brachionus plicatilis]
MNAELYREILSDYFLPFGASNYDLYFKLHQDNDQNNKASFFNTHICFFMLHSLRTSAPRAYTISCSSWPSPGSGIPLSFANCDEDPGLSLIMLVIVPIVVSLLIITINDHD